MLMIALPDEGNSMIWPRISLLKTTLAFIFREKFSEKSVDESIFEFNVRLQYVN